MKKFEKRFSWFVLIIFIGWLVSAFAYIISPSISLAALNLGLFYWCAILGFFYLLIELIKRWYEKKKR